PLLFGSFETATTNRSSWPSLHAQLALRHRSHSPSPTLRTYESTTHQGWLNPNTQVATTHTVRPAYIQVGNWRPSGVFSRATSLDSRKTRKRVALTIHRRGFRLCVWMSAVWTDCVKRNGYVVLRQVLER